MSNILSFQNYYRRPRQASYDAGARIIRAHEIKNISERPYEELIAEVIGFDAWAAAKFTFNTEGK